MKVNQQLRELLMNVQRRLTPDQSAIFVERIKTRLRDVEIEGIAGFTIAGALLGAVGEILPLDTLTGIDDWVEVGAALGATAGYLDSARHKSITQIEKVIQEELHHVLERQGC